jgi:hypothetical protein
MVNNDATTRPYTAEISGQVPSPTLLFWGLQSFTPVPKNDPRVSGIHHQW